MLMRSHNGTHPGTQATYDGKLGRGGRRGERRIREDQENIAVEEPLDSSWQVKLTRECACCASRCLYRVTVKSTKSPISA